jgi:hypothetical protein
MSSCELFHDRFSSYVRDDSLDAVELRWSEETKAISEDQFRAGIERLAKLLETERVPNVLIDVTDFAYRPSQEFPPWRDRFIIPRYNAAGVKKFAFLVLANATHTVENGYPPAVEGPGQFATGYFASRAAVVAWFESQA